MRFCDSHLHLYAQTRPGEVAEFAEWNETLLLSCGVDEATSQQTLRLARSFPKVVIPFVGVHPSEAEKEPDLGWLPSALSEAIGLGEVGLDPKYSDIGNASAQKMAFEAQLDAAEKARKPVQIHSREAESEVLGLLGCYRLPSVLMHWFEGEAHIEALRDRGYFVSLGPSLTYSKKFKRIAASFDREWILTETDWPVSYGPLEGANGPSLIPSVVFELSRIWKEPFEEARKQSVSNAQSYLMGGKG